MTALARLLRELRRRHAEADVDASLASLAVRVEGDTAIVARGSGAPLFESPPVQAKTIRLDPGVYAQTPTAGARVRLLTTAASIAPRVHVFAPTVTDGTYRGRLAIDLPRRAVHALGLSTAEPGDRFDGSFAHAFFDDEAIIDEAERAGLTFVARRGAWVLLERSATARAEHADSFSSELLRALRVVREAESLRREAPPERAVTAMRARGQRARSRGPVGRARLRRAVGWVDAAFPGGPNCFRRTLVEIGLDAGAAGETLVFGLDVGRTGHVAFKGTEERAFDVAFEIAPPGGSTARPSSDE